jgi:hypothetical protein
MEIAGTPAADHASHSASAQRMTVAPRFSAIAGCDWSQRTDSAIPLRFMSPHLSTRYRRLLPTLRDHRDSATGYGSRVLSYLATYIMTMIWIATILMFLSS